MAAQSFTVFSEIIAEPEQVWAVLCDLDRHSKMLTAVDRIERIDGPSGLAVGTRWKETRRLFGKTVDQEFVCSDVVPGRSVTVSADASGTTITIVYKVKPSSLGTRLEADLTVNSPGGGLGKRLASAVSGSGAAKTFRDELEQDLKDIAASMRR